jgi:hypothetical protein
VLVVTILIGVLVALLAAVVVVVGAGKREALQQAL